MSRFSRYARWNSGSAFSNRSSSSAVRSSSESCFGGGSWGSRAAVATANLRFEPLAVAPLLEAAAATGSLRDDFAEAFAAILPFVEHVARRSAHASDAMSHTSRKAEFPERFVMVPRWVGKCAQS